MAQFKAGWPNNGQLYKGNNHTILSGEGVRGGSLDVPVSNQRWLGEEHHEGVGGVAGDAQLSNLGEKYVCALSLSHFPLWCSMHNNVIHRYITHVPVSTKSLVPVRLDSRRGMGLHRTGRPRPPDSPLPSSPSPPHISACAYIHEHTYMYR